MADRGAFDPSRGGCAPAALLAAFGDLVEADQLADDRLSLEAVLVELRNCTDRLPAALSIRFHVPIGTTYGTMSRFLRAEADRDEDALWVEPHTAYKRLVRRILIERVEAEIWS